MREGIRSRGIGPRRVEGEGLGLGFGEGMDSVSTGRHATGYNLDFVGVSEM